MQGNLFRDKFYWKKVKRKIANMTGNLFRNKIYWEKLKDKFSQCTLQVDCFPFENVKFPFVEKRGPWNCPNMGAGFLRHRIEKIWERSGRGAASIQAIVLKRRHCRVKPIQLSSPYSSCFSGRSMMSLLQRSSTHIASFAMQRSSRRPRSRLQRSSRLPQSWVLCYNNFIMERGVI